VKFAQPTAAGTIVAAKIAAHDGKQLMAA